MQNGVYIFRAKLSHIFFYLVLLNLFLVFMLIFTTWTLESSYWIFLAINIFYILSIMSKRIPFEIEIDINNKIIRIQSMFMMLKQSYKVYPAKNLYCSFKEEVRSKGAKARVFRLVQNDVCIVEIVANYAGWSESVLGDIHSAVLHITKDL
jgi:hypothetical protein